MHYRLLHCGIYLIVLFCEFTARPIMFRDNRGLALSASDDNDKRTDIKLHGATKFGDKFRNMKNVNEKMDSNRNRMVANVSMTPEYMLELYKNLSNSSPDLHNSNIVRSFKNDPKLAGNSTDVIRTSTKHRVHSLGFDISALDLEENINLAQLRLYTLIKRDQRSYSGVTRVVSIYQLMNPGRPREHFVKYNFITSKYIYSLENAWESFDLTSAIKLSVQQGLRVTRLEVRIESLMIDSPNSDLDINATPNDIKQPILVVYSNDKSKAHEENVERRDFIMHELSIGAGAFASTQRGHVDNMYDYNSQELAHSRNRRSNGHNLCKRRPLYVNFADLNWDTWILAPKGYQAYQCAGRCTFPMGTNLSPSKHAIVQSLMNVLHPKRAVRSCCVPTKLAPMSLLYIEHGVVTYKYKYDQMVVAECGCR